jgi:hypothetical protein
MCTAIFISRIDSGGKLAFTGEEFGQQATTRSWKMGSQNSWKMERPVK